MNLLDKIASAGLRLTPGESALVDYLASHYPQGVLESATAIAAHTGISASTVVRFFSKLGYPSFPEVQREIREEVSARLASPANRAEAVMSTGQPMKAALEGAYSHDRNNLAATYEQLDVRAFEAAVQMLTRRGARVSLLASKNSAAVALYLATHLNMCLPHVRLLDGGPMVLADQLIWAGPDDVLLAISIRRYSRSILTAAKHVKARGGKVVALTDSPLAPVAALADEYLTFRTANASPFDSYTAAIFLGNALVSAVAARRGKEVRQALDRGEGLWTEFGVFTAKS
ncbi:SIS domain-containing protein [Xylophilus rhododendri]|uniref:SIS domain-containing protein n=1 Tax=Xylophilus rhododendri TaxID=2697032 RepID=A0A857J8W1_9BURK|nr:MurR/RpiR family transcriptional regulator [Xylophilus rhododendri]QHJ00415.1 SIS domain-containing protein [Xylophilus rhododendri]